MRRFRAETRFETNWSSIGSFNCDTVFRSRSNVDPPASRPVQQIEATKVDVAGLNSRAYLSAQLNSTEFIHSSKSSQRPFLYESHWPHVKSPEALHNWRTPDWIQQVSRRPKLGTITIRERECAYTGAAREQCSNGRFNAGVSLNYLSSQSQN